MSVAEYINHIHKQTDGYIQLLDLESKGQKTITKRIEEVEAILADLVGGRDKFLSSNSFYIPSRRSENVRQLRTLFIDLDIPSNMSKTEAVYQAYDLVAQEIIPEPTLIVDSGRGVHLYWRIDHAPKGAVYTWQQLQDYFYYKLKHLGADKNALDVARVLRLPGTINSKNGQECRIMQIKDTLYSMYDLREEYLDYQKPQKSQVKAKEGKPTKRAIKRLFNSYTLHKARLEDIKKLVELRSWDMRGYRSFTLHLFTYWQGLIDRDIEILSGIVEEFNGNLKEPLKSSEVKAILRSTPKAIEKFIEFEQARANGEDKRVSKGMRDKQGYWYTNDTLIERLGISIEEQRQLQTIISKEEKYRRNNLKRREARRNEQGETAREQLKRERVEEVKSLLEQGLGVREIARQLQLNVSLISRVKNDKY